MPTLPLIADVSIDLELQMARVSERLVRFGHTVLEEPMWRAAWIGRFMAPYRRLRFYHFGERSVVYRPTWLYGTHRISVGDDVFVHAGAWLSAERQAWDRDEPTIIVGDRVVLRTHSTLSAACSIRIEDDVVFGGTVTVVDSDHTWKDGQPSVLYNAVEADPIRIGRGSWIGDHVVVLRGSDIGQFCVVGANSVVRGKIPDHSIAVGAPARVVGMTSPPA